MPLAQIKHLQGASTSSTNAEQAGSTATGSTTTNSSTHTGHSDSQRGTGSNSTSAPGTSTNDQNDRDTNTSTGANHSNHSGSTSAMDHSSMDGMSANMSAETKKMMMPMHNMMQMMMDMEMSGDVDHDFAEMMIEHHKDAIEMAKVEVQHGKDPQFKAMAQKLIEDQTKEIGELEAWTKANNK